MQLPADLSVDEGVGEEDEDDHKKDEEGRHGFLLDVHNVGEDDEDNEIDEEYWVENGIENSEVTTGEGSFGLMNSSRRHGTEDRRDHHGDDAEGEDQEVVEWATKELEILPAVSSWGEADNVPKNWKSEREEDGAEDCKTADASLGGRGGVRISFGWVHFGENGIHNPCALAGTGSGSDGFVDMRFKVGKSLGAVGSSEICADGVEVGFDLFLFS